MKFQHLRRFVDVTSNTRRSGAYLLHCFPLQKRPRGNAPVVTAVQTRTAELFFQARGEDAIVVLDKTDVSGVRILVVRGCWLLAVCCCVFVLALGSCCGCGEAVSSVSLIGSLSVVLLSSWRS